MAGQRQAVDRPEPTSPARHNTSREHGREEMKRTLEDAVDGQRQAVDRPEPTRSEEPRAMEGVLFVVCLVNVRIALSANRISNYLISDIHLLHFALLRPFVVDWA